MWLIKAKTCLVVLSGLACLCTASFAAQPETHPHEYECPQEWTYQGVQYPLRSIAVFDGSIEVPFILKPSDITGETATWPFTEGETPFLQCRYKGTKHAIIIEAKGARLCQATLHENQPNTGFCK